jgi:hypothetical protein
MYCAGMEGKFIQRDGSEINVHPQMITTKDEVFLGAVVPNPENCDLISEIHD